MTNQLVVAQQATYAPDDGIHRWMGSIAQDRQGNMALGSSVADETDVFPGDPPHRPAQRAGLQLAP